MGTKSKKKGPAGPAPRPIGRQLRAMFEGLRERKVIDLSAVRAGKEEAQRLAGTVPRANRDADPAHAIYTQVSNLVSVLVEGLTSLPALDRFSEVIGKAEDEYQPSWPPMSPISKSHFTTWAMYDVAIGVDRETLCSIVLDIGDLLGLDEATLRIMGELSRSRLGLYVHEGAARGGHIVLREVMTGRRIEALCRSGHDGERGELWLVRVLPPPAPGLDYHVTLTSPYVIVVPDEGEWLAYLRRTLPKTRLSDEAKAYERLMKYGLGPVYWNEYIFEGYLGHTGGMIELAGLPDVAASRPHSRLVDGSEDMLRRYYGATWPG